MESRIRTDASLLHNAELYHPELKKYAEELKTPEYVREYITELGPIDMSVLDIVDDLNRSTRVQKYSRPQLLGIREALIRQVVDPNRTAQI